MAAGDFNMTAIVPILYTAAADVAKEPTGFLNAINLDVDDKQVALNDTLTVPWSTPNTVADYTPGAYAALGTATTANGRTLTLGNSKVDSWSVSGEQEQSLLNGGNGQEWMRQRMAQGFRVVRNAACSSLASVVYKGACQAVGTAGTTPFASDLSAITSGQKILRDNGAPLADLQCVTNSSGYMNIQNLGIVQQANLAGSDTERRTGILGPQYGFQLRVSSQIATHTKGAGTGYDVTSAGAVVGATTIPMEGGTVNTTGIKAGDIVTFSGGTADTTNYVVTTGLTATSGNVVIGYPGLKVVKVDADEMTIGNSYTPTSLFERNAVIGVLRVPYIPQSAIIQTQPVTDEYGMPYLFVRAVGDGIVTYRIHQVSGFLVVNPEMVVTIMG
jgi:hypothetical protein